MLKFPAYKAIRSACGKAPVVTLATSSAKCGKITQSSNGSLTVSAGKEATPQDIKKSVYLSVGRANQLKKETGVNSVQLNVDIPKISVDDCGSTTGLFFNTDPGKHQYAVQAERSQAFERVATYAALSGYRYGRFKDEGKEGPATLLLNPLSKVDGKAIHVGNVIASCVTDARNLGNLRHDEGNPASIADWIERNIVGKHGIKKRHVIVGDALVKGGLNMLHAVGKGAVHAPRMMVLEYIGAPKAKDTYALVGKGVTFDCGGLNVKPFGSMETMHLDKMGAVAVVNALRGAAELKLPVNIVAVVGLVENAIGPTSYHPSTILRSLKGKTVEVTNTDAEGRLVLADMLTFVQTKAKTVKKVSTIVDLATLTGAIVAALGDRRAGVFCNNGQLMKDLICAGNRVDELLWPMPVGQEHREQMKGKLSDLTNCRTKREGGACTAAAFLQEFIEDGVKWAHIDIAGPAMEETEKSAGLIGAPGFGVQLLIDYFRNL